MTTPESRSFAEFTVSVSNPLRMTGLFAERLVLGIKEYVLSLWFMVYGLWFMEESIRAPINYIPSTIN